MATVCRFLRNDQIRRPNNQREFTAVSWCLRMEGGVGGERRRMTEEMGLDSVREGSESKLGSRSPMFLVYLLNVFKYLLYFKSRDFNLRYEYCLPMANSIATALLRICEGCPEYECRVSLPRFTLLGSCSTAQSYSLLTAG